MVIAISILATGVRLVATIYFYFFACKIVMQEQQLQVYQTGCIYLFLFSTRKNCSVKVVDLGMPAIKAFLSNTYLAVFTFSIANKGIAATAISS